MKNLSPEEAVRILENMKVKFPVPRAAETQIKRNAALEMAIKALATDINVGDKDTISRKAAIDVVKGIDRSFVKYIEELPPAQPERIKGHWIKISPANIYECSECGKSVMTNDICAYDFCHGCGADMRGEQG